MAVHLFSVQIKDAMKGRYWLITVLIFFYYYPCKSQQHKDKGDSLFVAANERLKTKWEHLDSLDFAEALHEYTEVLHMKPEYWQAYRNRARIYSYLKRYTEALEDLTLAIAYSDKNFHPGLFEMRGIVFYNLGLFVDSVDDLTVAITSMQNNESALFWRSQARWKLGLQKEACRDLKEALKKNKDLAKKNRLVRCD